jgi:hypothetical protein
MSITSVSAGSNYYSSTTTQSTSSPRSNFRNLFQSLQSGDLAGAQQAYAAIQQSLPANAGATSAASAAGSSTASQPVSAIGSDFQAIGQALQSGDLSAAQQAFAKLQQDGQSAIQAHGGGHHHHHHGSGAGVPATASTSSSSSSSASAFGQSTSSSGGNVNTQA